MHEQTILIVDDDELQQRLLYDVLTVKGYAVLRADRGALAIELALRQRPDLVLLDIRLPDISGLQVARILKSSPNTRTIPIAAVTSQNLWRNLSTKRLGNPEKCFDLR